MTLTIELTPEEEARLTAKARAQGKPAEEFLRGLIAQLSDETSETVPSALPQTGAQALAYWEREGVFGLFDDRPDSPDFARELRRQAETRDWSA